MNDEPRRLLDDPEISGSLREDLTRAASDADVSFDAGAGLDRLRAAIGGPPPPPTPDVGTATSALGGGKALLVMAIAVGVVGVIAIAAYRAQKDPAPSPALIATPAAPTASAVHPKPIASAELSVDDLPSEPGPSAAASAPKPAESASPEERLKAEMKQLAEVRSAPPARALSLANEGHQRFKGGVFYQEREALAISALAALGRSSEAKARGSAFLSAFPRGPYAERVRKQTGLGGP